MTTPLRSENINEFALALSKAQGDITHAIHDKINPHFKSSYASINSVWDAAREPLSKNGLALVQQMYTKEDAHWLLSTLMHSSGQYMSSDVALEGVKASKHVIGSSLTYFRRYCACSLIGITGDEDDDANKAVEEKKESKKIEQSKPQVTINPEDELKHYAEFITQFLDQDIELIKAYCNKYCAHWKKSLTEMMKDYQNKDKFLEDFTKWKKQNEK